jgi:hypothetical protein
MAFPMAVNYSTLINTHLEGKRSISTSVNNLVEIPDGAMAGAITVTIISESTAQTLVDGTMLTNDTNTTQATMTYVDEAVTHSVPPSQIANFFNKPVNIERIAVNHANALLKSANAALVADFVAATPGDINTLATGRVDFTIGTTQQNTVMLSQVARIVAYIQDRIGDEEMKNYGIIVASAAFGNFTAIRGESIQYPVWDPTISRHTFMGIPIFSTALSTSFGGASNECMFIYHRDAAGLAFKDPGLAPGFPSIRSDGFMKWPTIGPYAHGVIDQAILGSILNPAS